MTLLTILIPVYNEAATVEQAIRETVTTELPVEHELVVIDDGSTDGTRDILRNTDWPESVRVFEHDRNRGKGAAVRTGVSHARGDISAILDADLEYTATDFERHDEHSVRRARLQRLHEPLLPLRARQPGRTLVANALFNVYIADLMTCHKVIRTDLFRQLPLRANGFEIEPEITARLVSATRGSTRCPCSTAPGRPRRARS
jgi:glycosyltransferase involved in cell wall biosynthesis